MNPSDDSGSGTNRTTANDEIPSWMMHWIQSQRRPSLTAFPQPAMDANIYNQMHHPPERRSSFIMPSPIDPLSPRNRMAAQNNFYLAAPPRLGPSHGASTRQQAERLAQQPSTSQLGITEPQLPNPASAAPFTGNTYHDSPQMFAVQQSQQLQQRQNFQQAQTPRMTTDHQPSAHNFLNSHVMRRGSATNLAYSESPNPNHGICASQAEFLDASQMGLTRQLVSGSSLESLPASELNSQQRLPQQHGSWSNATTFAPAVQDMTLQQLLSQFEQNSQQYAMPSATDHRSLVLYPEMCPHNAQLPGAMQPTPNMLLMNMRIQQLAAPVLFPQVESPAIIPSSVFLPGTKPHQRKKSPQPKFPVKLHMALSDAARDGNENVVTWTDDGKYFQVLDRERFVSEIIPYYFRMTNMASFRRQLVNYGFERVPRGPNEGAYHHERFHRDKPDLARHILVVRKLSPEEAANKAPGWEPSRDDFEL
ncbi:hypothetical protein MPSEU_000068500 [Mayamaea pseudoterrestris]|nr:hypothetical protein MPSEU_000068500 [Mayamaea pseudoterrestris]